MTPRAQIKEFMHRSPIHTMFVMQAIHYYADSIQLNRDKILSEENKNAIINPESLLVIAAQAKTLI